MTLYNFQKSLRPSKTRGLRSNKQTPTDTLTSILRSSRAAVDNRQLTEDGSVIIVGKRRGDARHSHMFLQEACPARRTSKFCTPSGPRPTSWSRTVSTALACGTRGTGSQCHAVPRLGPPCKFGWWVWRSCCCCGCRRQWPANTSASPASGDSDPCRCYIRWTESCGNARGSCPGRKAADRLRDRPSWCAGKQGRKRCLAMIGTRTSIYEWLTLTRADLWLDLVREVMIQF